MSLELRRNLIGAGVLAIAVVCGFISLLAAPSDAAHPPSPPKWSILHPEGLSDNADFGSAVAAFQLPASAIVISIVGAQNDASQSGKVFVYASNSSGSGSPRLVDVLSRATTGQPNETGMNFGCAIAAVALGPAAADGAVVAIGAQYQRSPVTGVKSGAVYLYWIRAAVADRDGAAAVTISFLRELVLPPTPTMREAPRFFGSAIGLSPANGKYLVVGAASGDTLGAVFVFVRVGAMGRTAYVLHETLTAQDAGFRAGSNFGQSVVVDDDGNTAVGVNHFRNKSGAVAIFPSAPHAQGSTARERMILATDPALPAGSYLGSQIALFNPRFAAEPDSIILFAAAAWAPPRGGKVLVFSVRIRTRTVAMIDSIEAPGNHSGVFHTFGCALGLLPSAPAVIGRKASVKLFVGDWSFGAGHVFSYDVTVTSACDASCVLAQSLAAPFPQNSGAYFGSSISAAWTSETFASVLVGAFAAFGDQGGATQAIVELI